MSARADGPGTPGPGTPGPDGYLVAFGVGFALLGAASLLPWSGDLSAFELVVAFGWYSYYWLFLPLVVAVGVVAVAMMACHGGRSQGTQVLIAALTSFVFGSVVATWAETDYDRLLLLVGMPAMMAIGRAAVIPFARRPGAS